MLKQSRLPFVHLRFKLIRKYVTNLSEDQNFYKHFIILSEIQLRESTDKCDSVKGAIYKEIWSWALIKHFKAYLNKKRGNDCRQCISLHK